ncbi:MAG: hypothetical protein ACLS95_04805 [Clostridia bacterium]
MFVMLAILGMTFLMASCLTIKWNWKQENSIVITFLSIGFILYLFGLLDHLLWGTYVIYAMTFIAGIYFIYSLLKKKVEWKRLFTLGTLLYVLLLVIVSLLLKNTFYVEWDEFSHWGPNLKAMVTRDVLWANQIYDGVHVVYPPLAGIIEYFFCKVNGGFSEEISYIAMATFVITLLLPLLRNLKYTLKDIGKGLLICFSVFCLICVFGFKLNSIYIDLLLGVLFAMAMLIAYQADTKADKILMVFLLTAMAILKETGLVLAGIVLMQLFFVQVCVPTFQEKKLKKENIKRCMAIICILVVMLAGYGSWKLYCSANGKVLDDRHDKNNISEINIQGFIQAVTQIHAPEGKLKDIALTFYDFLNTGSIIQRFPLTTVIQLLVFFDIIGIGLYSLTKDKEKRRKIACVFVSMTIGFILYALVLMATYMFAFTEKEGRALASYARYMETYFIAWAIIIIGMVLDLPKGNRLKTLTIIALVCLSATNITSLLRPVVRNVSGVSEEIQNQAQRIQEKVSIDDKVYLIFQNIGAKVDYHVLRYCISPTVTNLMYEWNLGAPYFEGDIWTYDITVQEWEKKLIEESFDYVFIAKSDERFVQDYGSLFAPDVDLTQIENKVFQVVKTSQTTVSLQECK